MSKKNPACAVQGPTGRACKGYHARRPSCCGDLSNCSSLLLWASLQSCLPLMFVLWNAPVLPDWGAERLLGPTPQVVGLRDGLLELGYRENEDFVIGVRFTQGDLTALPAAARQLVQDGVDIIFADHDEGAKAAQQATTQIPIVGVAVGDPLGRGLIQSFARPGGNITGVADLHLELGPKRLEVFREILPGLRSVLFLYHATEAYATAEAREGRAAAIASG